MSDYQQKFIGRESAIANFRQLTTRLAQQNALYIVAEGGLGKTWLLREYFEHHAGTFWRGWHVHPAAVEMSWERALIDFYRIENRSIAGLRRSIVERIGREFFEEFLKANARGEETAAEMSFFAGLQTARRKIKNYIVLFFDTFEVVYNLPVGRWFLETFLPNKAMQGYLIVFAGRPRPFELPANVAQYELTPFSKDEEIQYFEQKFGVKQNQFGESERQIIANSRGNPLLFDLWTHYASPVDDSEAALEPPERRLVKRFFEDTSPEGELLRSLAYLTRRFNREIFAAAGLRGDYETMETALKKYPFVKYRPGEHSLTLHDEFQRMLAEYGRDSYLSQIWKERLFRTVIQGWYSDQINKPDQPQSQRYLLEAEYLAYLLEHNPPEGLAYFEQQFEDEIKPRKEFERRSLLWGTVAAFLDDKGKNVALEQQFRLYQTQGDWLFEQGRYAEATYELHVALNERFETVRPFAELARLAVRLGHCYLQTQRMDTAEALWQVGLEQARRREARQQEQTFVYNLAHILNRRERLPEAVAQYEQAIQIARDLRLKKEYLESLYTCAPLQATVKQTSAAEDKINKALAQLNDPKAEIEDRERAVALIHLADTYRYLDRYDKAKELYKQAKTVLRSPLWQIRALTGEAATRLSIARAARKENSPDAAHENLQEAIDLFHASVEIARAAEIQPPPYRLFDRLAPLYRALHEIKFADNLPQPLTTLTEELPFLAQTAESALPFEQLPDFQARAQRLSELAYFLTIDQSAFHFALNSLLDAAISAAYRNRWQDIALYRRRAYALSALDVSTRSTFFTDLFNLLQAYKHLADENWDRGATELGEYAARVANAPGSGLYFLRHQEPIIRHYLEQLPQKYWQALIDRWQDSPQPLKGVAIDLAEKLYWN